MALRFVKGFLLFFVFFSSVNCLRYTVRALSFFDCRPRAWGRDRDVCVGLGLAVMLCLMLR